MVRSRRWMARLLACLAVGVIFLSTGAAGSAAVTGKAVYQKRCQACHGADGTGNPMMAKVLHVTFPAVNGAGLEKKSDAEHLRIIAEGKGKMPSFAKQLSEEERQQVLEYMKTLGQ